MKRSFRMCTERYATIIPSLKAGIYSVFSQRRERTMGRGDRRGAAGDRDGRKCATATGLLRSNRSPPGVRRSGFVAGAERLRERVVPAIDLGGERPSVESH